MKIDNEANQKKSCLLPIKYLLHLFWILGIFPISYDKQLLKFDFRLFSVSTGISSTILQQEESFNGRPDRIKIVSSRPYHHMF